MYVLTFFFTVFITCSLFSQDNWCSNTKLRFEVLSDNGVNMRKSKSLESEVILAIPFKEEVLVCRDFTGFAKVTIQGKTGYWMKSRYMNKIGYVHSANLKQVECNYTDEWWVSFPNDGSVDQMFHGYPVSCKGDKGVYLIENNENRFFTKPISYIDTSTDYSYLYFGKLEKHDNPYFIIHGKQNVKPKGFFSSKDDIFYPGESFTYKDSLLENDIRFFCTGSVWLDSAGYHRVKDYSLNVLRGNKVVHVVKVDPYPHQGGGYEGGIWLKWIGHLDEYDEPEIILRVQSTYKGWKYILLKWNGSEYESITIGGGSPA